MTNKRIYNVYIGSKDYFEENLPQLDDGNEADYFLALVKESDDCKQRGAAFSSQTNLLIVKNDNYHGITEQAHDRLGSLVEELTEDDATIYIHNPTRVLMHHLDMLRKRNAIELNIYPETHHIKRDSSVFSKNMEAIAKNIIGQDNAISEISKSMWYLTNTNRKKPYVIMLYGNSSIGKTELVREIADKFFENKYLEKHLSMFMNNTYSDYFFGEKPNRRTLSFELLERESNLVFLDEIDKCPAHFYSAFYTLFDNVLFADLSYNVDVSGLLIALTSNFHNQDEMKKELGLPIYYRIDKFIHFDDFAPQTIYNITMQEINNRIDEYKEQYTPEDIYKEVSQLIQSQGENARTIKYKIQEVIENMLFKDVVQ